MLGAFLATGIAQGAELRGTIPEGDRKDFTLYVDEFQNFATDTFTSILSEARKWRLNLVLSNQFLTQIPEKLQDGVLGNVGTLVVLRVGDKDAKVLAPNLDSDSVRRRLRQSCQRIVRHRAPDKTGYPPDLTYLPASR